MTIVNSATGATESEGCYCYIPEKAKSPGAVCWIHENGFIPDLEYGWPEELNAVELT